LHNQKGQFIVIERAALGNLGQKSPDVVNRLVKSFTDDYSSYSRSTMALALGQLGDNSPDVINALLEALNNDEEEEVRFSAIEALIQLGDCSSKIIETLLISLNHEQSYQRFRAGTALCRLSRTSINVLPLLVQWLKQQPNDKPIGEAIDTLWSIVLK
jgi:HEAT repeat protein